MTFQFNKQKQKKYVMHVLYNVLIMYVTSYKQSINDNCSNSTDSTEEPWNKDINTMSMQYLVHVKGVMAFQ
jgi:hypothetical protein